MSGLADKISHELSMLGIDHSIRVKRTTLRNGIGQVVDARAEDRSISMLTSFPSVRSLASALERAGADASYSAGYGWHFHAAGESKP